MPNLEIRQVNFSNGKVNLVLQTSLCSMGILDSSVKSSDVAEYFAQIDIHRGGSLADRTKMYGPLFYSAATCSSISLNAGAFYTQKDVDAAKTRAACIVDATGRLFKVSEDSARGIIVSDSLQISDLTASWRPENSAEIKPIAKFLSPGDQEVSPSGRYSLIWMGESSNLFDRCTASVIKDDWLTDSFNRAFVVYRARGGRMFFTDDLNHLILSPAGEDDLTLNGASYRCKDVSLIFDRPSREPTIFRKSRFASGDLMFTPRGALSIKGNLFLYAIDDDSCTLLNHATAKTFVAHAPKGISWHLYDMGEIQYNEALDTVYMIQHKSKPDKATGALAESLGIVRWKYREGDISYENIELRELFTLRSGELVPKSVMGVK